MLNWALRFVTRWYRNLSRRIFVKLILLIVIPNLLLLVIINQLMNRQIQQKLSEMDNTLYVLEHATSRELRGLFGDVTTLTNQILIEPEVQQILSGTREGTAAYQKEYYPDANELVRREKYMKQDILRGILSRYRLVWNNIFSIAILAADDGELYLNTSENYQITSEDLKGSLLLKEVASPDHTGLAWSVNDALTKKTDMITFARRIYGVGDPQRVIGYVLVNLSLNAVRGSFETYNYYGQMIFGLADQRESTWMIYDRKNIIGGQGRLLPYSLKDLSSRLTEVDLNGRTWRAVVMPMEKDDYLFIGLDAEYIRRASADIRSQLYFGYAFFLALAFLISLLGAKILTERLGKLNKAMRTLGQKQWGTRIELKGSDEIRVIGDTFNSMATHIEELLENLKEQQSLKRLFELRVLEYQINPHFLYNTLDTINWMALENNQTRISQMVNGLSKLFRMILSKGREVISLQEEFEMIRIYLNIQKIRFEDRFDYSVELDADVSRYPICKLVLQPIVENAIVHGIRRLRGPGFIRLTGGRAGEHVLLEISDNGVGMTAEQIRKQTGLLGADIWGNDVIASSGYGMKNVDSRLKLLFGEDYRMTLESSTEPPTGTTIRITIEESAMLGKLGE
ncbi:sensor histidine kinase [Paenibacillus filicis]|uniref:Sensor histidine kinase n=1 Tax=Paenibacillus gyeongsangnamensis TaxID=3388067 RepID=A0ABT4QJR3_9BACL|nr:sensor histidine kinase [Paenibacillus filicis]MCZ8516940.1 sensor histidine kinase [Paenibacillus filicis]